MKPKFLISTIIIAFVFLGYLYLNRADHRADPVQFKFKVEQPAPMIEQQGIILKETPKHDASAVNPTTSARTAPVVKPKREQATTTIFCEVRGYTYWTSREYCNENYGRILIDK